MATSMESNLTAIQQYVRQLQSSDPSKTSQSPQLQKLESIVENLQKQLKQKVDAQKDGSGCKWQEFTQED